jgi:hypothetical protein
MARNGSDEATAARPPIAQSTPREPGNLRSFMGRLNHRRQQHGSHSQASIGRLVNWVTPGIAGELRVTWVTRGDAGGWTAEVARVYLDRTNFNGFESDGAGAITVLIG